MIVQTLELTAKSVLTWWSQRQLGDHRLQSHAGNVSQLLFVRHHVRTQRVHHRLHLRLLHLTHQRSQAENQTHPKNTLQKDTQTLLVIFILRVTRTQNMWRRIFLPCLRQQHTFCQKLIVCVGWSIFLGRNQCTVQLMKQEAVQRLNKTRTSSYLTFHTDDQMLRRKLDLSAEALSFNHQFSDRKSDETLTKSFLSPKSAASYNFLSVK